jgi:hypothetical protein
MSTKVPCGAYEKDTIDTGPVLHTPLRLPPSLLPALSCGASLSREWHQAGLDIENDDPTQSSNARDFCIMVAEAWHLSVSYEL